MMLAVLAMLDWASLKGSSQNFHRGEGLAPRKGTSLLPKVSW